MMHRAASAQQELEGSVNGLKKETGAQLRELASDRGEALRALEGAKHAAEQRQHQLQASWITTAWHRPPYNTANAHHAVSEQLIIQGFPCIVRPVTLQGSSVNKLRGASGKLVCMLH